jgi:tRNA A37 methylthiotransferase MiaB
VYSTRSKTPRENVCAKRNGFRLGCASQSIQNLMKGKLYIKTHGCQMNEYDSAKMRDVLAVSHGLELTEHEDEADVILINTCSIRDKAQEKVFSQLGRWRELKKRKPGVVIGVGGCVASQEGSAIFDRAPYVDMVFGPHAGFCVEDRQAIHRHILSRGGKV